MFSLAKIIISKPNIRNYSKTYSKVDSGIHWRKKFLQKEDDFENPDFDDQESDFMTAHKTHREHLKELQYTQEKQQYHLVRQKYFKEKYPNFLTWHDKERIKYLYSTESEQWTIDMLSEAFPALPQVIKRIVKSNWTRDSRRVKNHDSSVQKNWEMFKAGQIPGLPLQLVEHLNKFTDRDLNLSPFEAPNKKNVVEVRRRTGNTEFADIITSYEKLKNKNTEGAADEPKNNLDITLQPPSKGDSYVIDKQKRWGNRPVTLQVVQDRIQKKIDKGKKLSENDKLIARELEKRTKNIKVAEEETVDVVQHEYETAETVVDKDKILASDKLTIKEKRTEKNVKITQEEIIDIAQHKYETAEKALVTKPAKDYSHLIYPEKIIIPKGIQKQGYTYKLNDCYYDDDGRFLYRVPGMG